MVRPERFELPTFWFVARRFASDGATAYAPTAYKLQQVLRTAQPSYPDQTVQRSACTAAGSVAGKQKDCKKNYGAPGENRTPNLMVRSHALYPIELRARPRL